MKAKLIVNTETRGALDVLHKATDHKASMPILTHCLVRAEGARLVLRVTDLHVDCEISLPAEVSQSGAVCVPMRALRDAVKQAGKGKRGASCTIEASDTSATIGAARVPTMAALDYPAPCDPTSPETAILDGADLAGALSAVAPAMCDDETRPHLAGVALARREGSETLVCFATDGHRLAHTILPGELPARVRSEGLLLPRRAVDVLGAGLRLGACVVQLGRNDWLTVANAGLFVRVRVDSELTPPPWSKVVPKRRDIRHQSTAGAYLEALDTIAVCVGKAPHDGMRVVLGSVARFEASDPDLGEASAPLVGVVDGAPAEDVAVGVSVSYLRQALRTMGKGASCALHFGGPLDPIALVAPEAHWTIMPRRL